MASNYLFSPKLKRKLKNEVGIECNQFNIIRGKQNLKIGKNFWLGYFCILDASSGLEIGDNVTISSGCHIYSHDSSDYRKYNLKKDPINGTHVKRAPVVIGNNVQIGANSVVLPGVTIGSNVIIGALSLVNKNIPNNCIAYGIPAKIKNVKNYFNTCC